MRIRTAPSRRRLRVAGLRRRRPRVAGPRRGRLVALALVAGAVAGVLPARAVTVNNLSPLGDLGVIRVRPVERDRDGWMQLLRGDGLARNDPNRTVGDTLAACVPGSPGTDCRRTLALPALAGVTTIAVNDGRLFLRGDTIQIGSPHCNYIVAGPRCDGEQPRGEIAIVTGGAGMTGPSTLTLAAPLAFTHDAGTRVVKLPALYQGQTLRVEIPNGALTRNGAVDVEVSAEITFPGFDPTNPSHRRPVPTTPNPPKTAGDYLAAASGTTGATFFYITKEQTGRATPGRTFDASGHDGWYQVEVTAFQAGTRVVVADGIVRFKLNRVAFGFNDCDANGQPDALMCVNPDPAAPTQPVTVRGMLVDGSHSSTTDRRVDAVIVDVAFTLPDGATRSRQVTSCYDTDPRPEVDNCGTLVPGAPPSRHGEFQAVLGGAQCIDTTVPALKPPATPATPAVPSVRCVTGDAAASMLDTSQTGSYQVDMSIRGVVPAVTISGWFDVLTPR